MINAISVKKYDEDTDSNKNIVALHEQNTKTENGRVLENDPQSIEKSEEI